jgi:hypothetical protein
MEEKENFYHELDKKKKSYCTCQTLILGLLIVIALIVIGAVVMIKKVKTAVAPERQITSTTTDIGTIKEKIENLEKAPGTEKTLVITEKELTALLVQGISNDPSVPLRDIQAAINPDAIELTGKATELLNTSINLSVVPVV